MQLEARQTWLEEEEGEDEAEVWAGVEAEAEVSQSTGAELQPAVSL